MKTPKQFNYTGFNLHEPKTPLAAFTLLKRVRTPTNYGDAKVETWKAKWIKHVINKAEFRKTKALQQGQ